jgi:hypothetical protein
MHALRKGEAFPQVGAAEPQVIVHRTERNLDKLGQALLYKFGGGRLSAPENSNGKRLMASVSLAMRGTACENLSFATYFVRAAWCL